MAKWLNKPWAVWAILAAALALRLAASIWWQARLGDSQALLFGDSQSYLELGRAIAHGGPYEYGSPDARVFRTPGYPLVLAGLFVVAGDRPPLIAARFLGAALGTIAVAGVYCLARQLFDTATGALAALMAAVYPGAIGSSVFILSEAAFTPLLVWQLWLAAMAQRAIGVRACVVWSAAAGGCAGLATLVRPSWLLFVPVAALVGVAVGRDRVRRALLGTAALLGLIGVMAPWWIRNGSVVGHFVPTTLQVGASLYDGLNPTATGGSEMSFVGQFTADERAKPWGDAAEPFELRLDRRMRTAALDWASAHPGRVAELAWIKFLRMWNVWPNEAEFRSWTMRAVVACAYVPLVGLAVVGSFKYTRFGLPYMMCWLPAVYLTALHLVFVSSIRYREPAMLPAMALAAAALLSSAPRATAP